MFVPLPFIVALSVSQLDSNSILPPDQGTFVLNATGVDELAQHDLVSTAALVAMLITPTAAPGSVRASASEIAWPLLDANLWQAEASPRPLAPESTPFTIEPGSLAIELDLLNYSYGRHNPDQTNTRVHSFQWPVLLRFGVTENIEAQLGLDAFVLERERDRAAGMTDQSSGFGNITPGLKINIWGNDGHDYRGIPGHTALAIAPYLRLPTNRHRLDSRAVEGGVLIPFHAHLPGEFELDIVPGFAAVRDSSDDDYVFEWYNVLSISRMLIGDFSWFAEFESIGTTESSRLWEASLNAGLTWDVDDDLVLELTVGRGVTRAAPDWAAALTLVKRF